MGGGKRKKEKRKKKTQRRNKTTPKIFFTPSQNPVPTKNEAELINNIYSARILLPPVDLFVCLFVFGGGGNDIFVYLFFSPKGIRAIIVSL